MTPSEKRRLDYLDAKSAVLEFTLTTMFAALLVPVPDEQVEVIVRDMENLPIMVPPDCTLTEAEIDALMIDTAKFKGRFYKTLRERVEDMKAKAAGTG